MYKTEKKKKRFTVNLGVATQSFLLISPVCILSSDGVLFHDLLSFPKLGPVLISFLEWGIVVSFCSLNRFYF